MMLRVPFALAAFLLIGGCASSSRFIETSTIELGHAPGDRNTELGEDGYLQVQVSSNIGADAERLKFYGKDAPKLIVVTAKLQPNAGPGRDTPAPEVPLLSYDVGKATSEDLTARTLAGGIVVKAGTLSGAATLTLIVRGITESGASTLGPLMETIKKTPAAITGVATVLGGVPITAFQTFVVPMLEKSATSANRHWERKKEYTFQVGSGLDGLDGRVVAFVLTTDDKKRPSFEVELCSLQIENPRLCVQQQDKAVPFTTPYLLFDLRVSDFRPIDDLVPQGGPCATDRAVLAKTADAITAGALTGRQAFFEDLLLKRRMALADIRESGGSIDRLSRAAWRFQRQALPTPEHPRYAYWQRYMAARSARLDACLDEALATATPTTRRTWSTLLDGFRSIDAVDAAIHRSADSDGDAAPAADDAALVEQALRRMNTAEAVPAIDAESRAYLVAGISNASGLLERWYRSEVLRITGSASGPEAATRELKKLLNKTRCTSCASIVNTAISSLQSGAGIKSTEAAVRRDSLVVDALRTGARVDAAKSLSDDPGGSNNAVREAVDKSLEVKPGAGNAGTAIDALQDKVDAQRNRADSSLEHSAPAPAPAAVPVPPAVPAPESTGTQTPPTAP